MLPCTHTHHKHIINQHKHNTYNHAHASCHALSLWLRASHLITWSHQISTYLIITYLSPSLSLVPGASAQSLTKPSSVYPVAHIGRSAHISIFPSLTAPTGGILLSLTSNHRGSVRWYTQVLWSYPGHKGPVRWHPLSADLINIHLSTPSHELRRVVCRYTSCLPWVIDSARWYTSLPSYHNHGNQCQLGSTLACLGVTLLCMQVLYKPLS